MSAQVCVIGVGRIGAVTAVGLSHLGYEVLGLDRSAERVAQLRAGSVPEAEPGLRAALTSARRYRSLTFGASADGRDFEFVFLCVDTPPLPTLEPDLCQVFAAADDAGALLRRGGILITRSTVPVGTGSRIAARLAAQGRPDIEIVHVPEFLREGRAWEDFRTPDRIVIGADTPQARSRTSALFAALACPRIEVDRRTAELSKYVANAYLATSISFANEVADLCQGVGVAAADVFEILKADSRVGPSAYLTPGLGFGGHCLPKDTAALEHLGVIHGLQMAQLAATRAVNNQRPGRAVAWLRSALGDLVGRRIAILGLSFKPQTDDLRESPSLHLARLLALEGASVVGWDPHVRRDVPFAEVQGCMEDALRGAEAVVVGHGWSGWRELDASSIAGLVKRPILYDAPGLLDLDAWHDAGFLTPQRGLAALEA